MNEVSRQTKYRDGLLGFGALYAALTLAGNTAGNLLMLGPIRVASLLLFAALAVLYAIGTMPGRRTGWGTFFLCGLLLPGAVLALAIVGYALPLSYEAFGIYEVLVGGFGVGFEVGGGYVSATLSLILWALLILLATIAAPMLRGAIDRLRASNPSSGQSD